MANNVGNISIGLSLDNQSFEAVLNGSASRLRRFEGDVTRSGAAAASATSGVGKLSGSVSGLGSVMQSVSFGAGDFISQLGTRGLGGGLQAAANNIQQLGAAFGPTALAVSAGVGVAATALGVYIEQQDRAAKRTKALVDENAKAWKTIGQDAQKGAEEYRLAFQQARGENADIVRGVGSPSGTDLKRQIKDDEQKLLDLQRQKQALTNEFNRALPKELSIKGGLRGFAQSKGVTLPSGEQVSIADATSRTGPLLQRTIGPSIKGREADFGLNKESIARIGRAEQELIKVNDQIDATIARGEARAKQLPTALKRDAANEQQQESDRKRVKELDDLAAKEKQLQQEGDAFRQSQETPGERFKRRQNEIIDLSSRGAITRPEAAKGLTNLEQEFAKQQKLADRQPNTLPSFQAGAQETLSAINRVIRGSRESKVVETNTANTVKEIKKQTEEIKTGFTKTTRINVVRFN